MSTKGRKPLKLIEELDLELSNLYLISEKLKTTKQGKNMWKILQLIE